MRHELKLWQFLLQISKINFTELLRKITTRITKNHGKTHRTPTATL